MKPPFDYLPAKTIFRAVAAVANEGDRPHLVRLRLIHQPGRLTGLGDAATLLYNRKYAFCATTHEEWIIDEHDPRYTAKEFATYWEAAVELPPLTGAVA